MDFLPERIEEYVLKNTSPESEVLQKLNRETYSKVLIPRMLSGHLQGRVLSMLSQMIQPSTILEIGTYTGYSAICLAEGLKENGTLYTIDINEELETMVNKYFHEAGISNKVNYMVGDAMNIIPTLDVKFDLVFIDADKENYSRYYELVFPKIRTGGFIIADNVLWSGKVLDEAENQDNDTKALVAFSKKVQEDVRVTNLLLPIRDGLMIIRKK